MVILMEVGGSQWYQLTIKIGTIKIENKLKESVCQGLRM
jgi:hypothetical protein